MPLLSIYSIFDRIPSITDDDNEDENPPQPLEDIHSTPQLRIWIHSTRNVEGSLAGDPVDRQRTRFQFERASSLLAQVPENPDPKTFEEASGHPDWDKAMNEEYRSLLANDTWDLVPLPKGRKLVRCRWVYKTSLDQMEKWIDIKLVLSLKDFHKLKALTILKPSPLLQNEFYPPCSFPYCLL